MPTMPNEIEATLKATLVRILANRDREWEEALRAGFPGFSDRNPPLIPSMVPEWAKGIVEDFEREIQAAWDRDNNDD